MRLTSAMEEKEDSNDDGLVELIEIVDEDSKSHEGSNMTPSEVSESTSMAVEEELEEPKEVKMEIDKESEEPTVQVGVVGSVCSGVARGVWFAWGPEYLEVLKLW